MGCRYRRVCFCHIVIYQVNVGSVTGRIGVFRKRRQSGEEVYIISFLSLGVCGAILRLKRCKCKYERKILVRWLVYAREGNDEGCEQGPRY